MTFHVKRSGQQITVHHSPSKFEVTEDVQYMRGLHEALSKHIADADLEKAREQEKEKDVKE